MTDRRMAREGCSSAGTHHGRETNWWIAFLQKHSWWWLKLPRPWILTQVTSSGTAKAWQLLTDNHFQMALIPPIQTLVRSPPLSCFKKFWLLFPPTLACPSVTDADPSYFSPFWVYVCVACRNVGMSIQTCGYMCLHALLHRCAHVQSPQSPALAFHLIHWTGVSQTNPELSNTASLREPACPASSFWATGDHQAQLTFTQSWGFKYQFSCLYHECFNPWATSQSASQTLLHLPFNYPIKDLGACVSPTTLFFFQLVPYFSCRQGGSLNHHHQSFPEKHQRPYCL